MCYLSIGFFIGLVSGMIIGLTLMHHDFIVKCQTGNTWKTVDYTYSCTATRRD
jgi:hypothetical protein